MKTYSKIQLIAMALEVFAKYPQEDKVFAREDGNIFFSENHADLERGKMQVFPFTREEMVKEANVKEAKVIAFKTTKEVTPKVKKEQVPAPAGKANSTLGKEGKSPETRNSNTDKK